jgi:uncharacterized damage-inducible protein DinB
MAQPEIWLRGPLDGYPALLQPVAHSLLQCREDVNARLAGVSPDRLWTRPNGAASAGYHVRHAAGSLARLLTYARGEQLSAEQMTAFRGEAEADAEPGAAERLLAHFTAAIDSALEQVKRTPESTLLDAREVGRGKLPSTVIGLLFHAAEHTQRHVGQLITTLKIVDAA